DESLWGPSPPRRDLSCARRRDPPPVRVAVHERAGSHARGPVDLELPAVIVALAEHEPERTAVGRDPRVDAGEPALRDADLCAGRSAWRAGGRRGRGCTAAPMGAEADSVDIDAGAVAVRGPRDVRAGAEDERRGGVARHEVEPAVGGGGRGVARDLDADGVPVAG